MYSLDKQPLIVLHPIPINLRRKALIWLSRTRKTTRASHFSLSKVRTWWSVYISSTRKIYNRDSMLLVLCLCKSFPIRTRACLRLLSYEGRGGVSTRACVNSMYYVNPSWYKYLNFKLHLSNNSNPKILICKIDDRFFVEVHSVQQNILTHFVHIHFN